MDGRITIEAHYTTMTIDNTRGSDKFMELIERDSSQPNVGIIYDAGNNRLEIAGIALTPLQKEIFIQFITQKDK